MEYQKIINLSENTPNQSSKLRTRNLVEINYESRVTYKNKQIRIKNSTLRSSLCGYGEGYMLVVSGTITIDGAGADDAAKRLDERNK